MALPQHGNLAVSTHSRPKAAGAEFGCGGVKLGGFNTQPPEGGWRPECDYRGRVSKFQHTAARRRLVVISTFQTMIKMFQHTAARRRLVFLYHFQLYQNLCFNTQPPEGGWQRCPGNDYSQRVSTHSRPKAAGSDSAGFGQHTRFQHTAARRRLVPTAAARAANRGFNTQPPEGGWYSFMSIIMQ